MGESKLEESHKKLSIMTSNFFMNKINIKGPNTEPRGTSHIHFIYTYIIIFIQRSLQSIHHITASNSTALITIGKNIQVTFSNFDLKSVITLNHYGPNIDPCGTPQATFKGAVCRI